MPSRAAALALACALLGGCRGLDAGLGGGGDQPDELPAAADAGDPDGAAPADAPSAPTAGPDLAWDPPPGVPGLPADVGCADGTREGFPDPLAWRDVAGCSGAWSVEGLQNAAARVPQCERRAGNSGAKPGGEGCSVADLCAEGWRVCEDTEDVTASSPTGCESASPSDRAVFFIVRGGATVMGVCGPQPGGANDLHGCGNFGRPESATCAPLSRRLGFADCAATGGIWRCGDSMDYLDEGSRAAKSKPALGGALCCRIR
jgi:hypothetical protein